MLLRNEEQRAPAQPCRNPSRPPAPSACDHRLPRPIPVRECSGRANPPASTRILSPSANFPSTRILNINLPTPPATSNIFGEQVQDLLRQLPGRTSGAGHLGGQKSPSRTIGEQINPGSVQGCTGMNASAGESIRRGCFGDPDNSSIPAQSRALSPHWMRPTTTAFRNPRRTIA